MHTIRYLALDSAMGVASPLTKIFIERDASMEADLLNLLRAAASSIRPRRKRKRVMFLNSLVTFVEHLLATPDLIRLHVVLRAEATNTDHPAKDYFAQRDAATIAWLAQRLTPFSERPISTATQIMAMMIGLQSLWLEDDQRFDLSQNGAKHSRRSFANETSGQATFI